MRERGARERVGGFFGIGVAVAGRVHTADEPPREPGHDGVKLVRPQQTRRQPELARDGQPLLEARHPRLVGGEREVAALDPLDIGAQLALEAPPHPIRLEHQRHLQRIAALLAHEAPVLARLLTGHATALDDDDAHATSSEEVCGGAADDAGAHDDDVRLTRPSLHHHALRPAAIAYPPR